MCLRDWTNQWITTDELQRMSIRIERTFIQGLVGFLEKMMTNNTTHTFVLVHGAWLGGWVWGKVAAGLRKLGHHVSTPTLCGIGERRHIGTDTASLNTHIEDLVAHIEMEDFRNVILVGWSYGGVVITGAFPRIVERIKSLIYLDAFVPECGRSVADCSPPAVRSVLEAHKLKDEPIPPLPLSYVGITDQALADFVTPRLSGQPWRTLFESLQTSWREICVPKSYIRCAAHDYAPFNDALERMRSNSDVRTALINTRHACMLTDPRDTINAFLSFASLSTPPQTAHAVNGGRSLAVKNKTTSL